MTFVEFTVPHSPNLKIYFVGEDLASVIASTKHLNFLKSSSYKEVSQRDVKHLKFKCFRSGIRATKRGCSSYYIGDRVMENKKKGW